MEVRVRVLLTGATGLIGSAVLARLRREGHEVAAVARGTGAAERLPEASKVVALDMREATRPEDWLPHLAGIDAVVNCAGVLQDGPRDSTSGVHVAGATALFGACERAGARRIVHVSALGVDRGAGTAFAKSKLNGDEELMRSDLEWVILRPSVVVGRASYGGSALFRGLAALPVAPRVAGARTVQVVQLEDLVRTVSFFLRPGAPARVVLDIAGPQNLALEDIVATYRRWLACKPAAVVRVPGWMAQAAFHVGDLLGLLGWRAPIRSTALREIMRGVEGDPSEWTRVTGIEPTSLRAALAAEPASVQERWFARLYLLKPVVLGVLALYWIASGLIALGPGWHAGVALIERTGMHAAGPLAAASALADIVIGLGIALRSTSRRALWAALAVSGTYMVLGTALLPELWADPLGPLLKIAPIVVLNLVALAILDDR
jgi:uncharacterized protein YbjT (DUF2867 family)